jgi:hypothetical protein
MKQFTIRFTETIRAARTALTERIFLIKILYVHTLRPYRL